MSSLCDQLSKVCLAMIECYMMAQSEQERHSWINAIDHNIKAYAVSQDIV